jgi:protein-L-isoaspartate(D-aspartate) O-methyltransferase
MKQYVNFIAENHNKTKRNYVRVPLEEKAACAEIAKRFERDYWDGDRKHGYGGYRYDGRWEGFAKKLIDHYKLTNSSSILDVGCGKGFQLYEIHKLLPGAKVLGIDVSQYGIENAPEGIQPFLKLGNAKKLEFPDKSFDFVYSLNAIHNLFLPDLATSLREIQRVAKKDAYVVMDSYRNVVEKENLLSWQLTCESFYTPDEWKWIFDQTGYTGDYEFIFFQ